MAVTPSTSGGAVSTWQPLTGLGLMAPIFDPGEGHFSTRFVTPEVGFMLTQRGTDE